MDNGSWFSFSELGNTFRNWGRKGPSKDTVINQGSNEDRTNWLLAAILDELALMNRLLKSDKHPVSSGKEVCLRCWQNNDLPAVESSMVAYGASKYTAIDLEESFPRYNQDRINTVREINPGRLRDFRFGDELIKTRNQILRKLNAKRKARQRQEKGSS